MAKSDPSDGLEQRISASCRNLEFERSELRSCLLRKLDAQMFSFWIVAE
jgi:hypothetical protein